MTTHLLTFRFGGDTTYEGQHLGALERIEAAGRLRVLDALIVLKERGGELAAIRARDSADVVSSMVSARLDPGARRRQTERALRGDLAEVIQRVGDALEPGGAWAVLLADTTAEAIETLGATSAPVQARRLGEVAGRLA